MPNGWEPPNLAILPAPIQVAPTSLAFMFRIVDGKCRLKYDEEGWRSLRACQTRHWRGQLETMLAAFGTRADYQTAKEVFKL